MKVKLFEGGIMPTQGHFADAGFDLYCPEDEVVIRPNGGSAVIDLRVGMEIPIGWYGKLESKSGLNVNHKVVSLGGIIDAGFRGSIKARMYNFGLHHTFSIVEIRSSRLFSISAGFSSWSRLTN